MRAEYDFSKARRGAVIALPKGKARITIRIDQDLVAWFKQQVHAAGGGNYQTLMNEALRRFVGDKARPIEAVLRRVVREELARAQSGRRPRRARAA